LCGRTFCHLKEKVAKTGAQTEDAMAKVRLRAERKIGELTKLMEKAQGNQYAKSASADKPLKQKTLECNGFSHQDASEYERLADIPDRASRVH
jgi:hypothetical protein